MESGSRVLLVVAGLMGACGVGAAAVAAHVTGGELLQTASLFLMLHAVAATAVVALAMQLSRGATTLRAGAGVIVLGTFLFSGDLAARALLETKLLGGSAPFGGSLMIIGWLVVAVSAMVARRA